jgi:hypothetical protein
MENKRFKRQLRSDTKKRQTFSDRICDDLCEVLLSYLSFQHKIRFECVSKQWQKLIFNKQFIIEINEYPNQKENTLNSLMKKRNEFNVKAFESLLKKSKFINNIIIDFNYFNINIEEVLQLIIKNCNNLKSITFNFNTICDQLIEKFGLKFGQKLRQICFINTFESNDNIIKYKKLLSLCPNLITLSKGFLTDLSLFVDSNQLLIPKLSSIRTTVQSKDIQLFERFTKNYANSLKSISIRANGLNQNEINVLMRNLVHLKSLIQLQLSLHFVCVTNKNMFFDNFKSMAIECKQLKRFEFCVLGINESLFIQLFKCLGFFENLNVLHLNLFNNKQINEMSCQSFKELKHLTQLIIEFPKTNDIFFEDIDKHLPQIKHLEIFVDNKITDKAMNSLSKLSKLQSIKIGKIGYILPNITDSGLFDIINNCPQINSIVFYKRPNISYKTIDALIALALRKPRVQYKHHFYAIEKDFYSCALNINFVAIDLKSFEFPNNLIVREYR